MAKRFKWHGEPVKTRFGYCTVHRKDDKPLYWYNYEIGTQLPTHLSYVDVPAIEVTIKGGQTFLISNHFGIGEHKLRNGGWPSYSHFTPDGRFWEFDERFSTTRWGKFDELSYSEHESKRRNWQKKNHPKEFEKSEELRKMMRKSLVFGDKH